MNTGPTIACAAAAYLLGSISFAWLIAKKLQGVDLRTVGSGNLGATNAGRLLGRKWAVVVYVLDFLKGFAPVLLIRTLGGDPIVGATVPVALIAGVAAFLGHCFPVWHRFRGGKGVATASGVILALTPLTALVVVLVFAVVVGATRRISLGSICAAVALPAAQAFFREGSVPRAASATLAFYGAMAALIIARHRKNVVRLIRGQEPKIGERTG